MRTSDNLLEILWRGSPSDFLRKPETSSDRSHEVPDTPCSSVADGSRQTGGPFLPRTCVGTVRSATDSRFSCTGSFLDVSCTRCLSSSSSESACGLNEQEVRHLRLPPDLVRELDMLICALTKQKLHASSGEQIADAILADTQDPSSPTQCVRLWRTQLEKSSSQKMDM